MSEILPLLTAFAERPDNLFALLYRYRVIVPVFQRHYVQGAANPKAEEVRKHFVESLLTGQNLHLNFIYGPICTDGEDAFTPVDGQQRLTTLWLLARYAAEQLPHGREGDRTGVLRLLSRFSYAGRQHAERFCEALTQEDNNWDIDKEPSKAICRQKWFWPSWREDETVDSMLRMLDTIHGQWKHDPQAVLEALHTNITFSLQIDSFADDIYMKMNARGLQLTQWENFKGKFAELLDATSQEQDWLKDITCQMILDTLTQSSVSRKQVWKQVIEILSNCYFSKANPQLEQSAGQVDTSKVSLPDDAFFALIARVLVVQLRTENKEVPEHLSALADFIAADWNKADLPFVPFGEFEKTLEKVDVNEFALDVMRMLDFVLTDGIAELPSPYWQDERTLFESVFHPKNQNERDLAWLVYMWRKKNSEVRGKEFTLALRCMWNILENDTAQGADRLDQFQKFFIEQCGPSLYGKTDKELQINSLQWREEVVKAQIYNEHTELVASLQEAEGYLHGRVRLGILNLGKENAPAEICKERLDKLNEIFEVWNEEGEATRKIIIMNLVAAQSYGLIDVFELNIDDETLRKMLTNRNDKDMQPHLMKIDINSVPQKPFAEANYGDWQLKENGQPRLWVRDWRQVLLDIFNGQGGYGVYVNDIWGRKVRWHNGSGLYYLYCGNNITWSLPINDWRIDLLVIDMPNEWFKGIVEEETGNKIKSVKPVYVMINDSNTIQRRLPSELAERLEPYKVLRGLYFMQDGIDVIVISESKPTRWVKLWDAEKEDLSSIPDRVERKLNTLLLELSNEKLQAEGASVVQEG